MIYTSVITMIYDSKYDFLCILFARGSFSPLQRSSLYIYSTDSKYMDILISREILEPNFYWKEIIVYCWRN